MTTGAPPLARLRLVGYMPALGSYYAIVRGTRIVIQHESLPRSTCYSMGLQLTSQVGVGPLLVAGDVRDTCLILECSLRAHVYQTHIAVTPEFALSS